MIQCETLSLLLCISSEILFLYISLGEVGMSQIRATIQEQWAKWSRVTDLNQLEWVIDYLVKKRHITSPSGMTHDHIANFYSAMATRNLAEAQLLMNGMKAAWSQKKNRDKNNGRKGYSFVMSTGTQKMLEQLARSSNDTISGTLEKMIRDVAQFKSELQKDQKANIERAKAQQSRAKDSFEKEVERRKYHSGIHIQKLNKEIEIQYAAIHYLALEKYKNHALVEETGLIDLMNETLVKEKEDGAVALTEAHLTKLKGLIKLETGKIKPVVSLRRLHAERS